MFTDTVSEGPTPNILRRMLMPVYDRVVQPPANGSRCTSLASERVTLALASAWESDLLVETTMALEGSFLFCFHTDRTEHLKFLRPRDFTIRDVALN